MDVPVSLYLSALVTATALTLCVVAVHYEALRLLSLLHPRHWNGKITVGILIVGIIGAHCLEALIFGVGYWLGAHVLGLGELAGSSSQSSLAYVYFSLETFTTQSLGDIVVTGPLRLVAAIEPLVGLILIGWSTSFTFVVMQRNWRTPSLSPTDDS